jgi:uncharacterized protein YjbI with pentapeptide repeats
MTDLRAVSLQGANLTCAHLEGADMDMTHFGSCEVDPEDLARIRRWLPDFPAKLPAAKLDGTILAS